MTPSRRISEVRSDMAKVRGEFYDALDAYVVDGIRKAVARTKGNGRKTLQAQDL